jgi:hypothetical protein
VREDIPGRCEPSDGSLPGAGRSVTPPEGYEECHIDARGICWQTSASICHIGYPPKLGYETPDDLD